MAERSEATFDAREAGASREERETAIAAIREALKRAREVSTVKRRRGSAVFGGDELRSSRAIL